MNSQNTSTVELSITGRAWFSAVIIAPANATVRGDDYQCNAGFTEDDNGLCVAVVAPANATVRGDGWTYNPGYARTESDSCRRIN